MKRPTSLAVGVILQWIASVVMTISGLDLIAAALTMSREGVAEHLEAALRERGINDIAGSLIVVGVFVAGVAIVALALIRIVVASYLWQGRSWARILLAVLICVNILTGCAYLVEGYVMRALFIVPIDLVILMLIFNGNATAFIRERSADLNVGQPASV